MPGKARKKTAAKDTVEPALLSPEWEIYMKDRIIKGKDECIAALQEHKDLLLDKIGRLEAKIEEYKFQIAQMEAGSQPVKKRATRRGHSFQVITGGKLDKDFPGDPAAHS